MCRFICASEPSVVDRNDAVGRGDGANAVIVRGDADAEVASGDADAEAAHDDAGAEAARGAAATRADVLVAVARDQLLADAPELFADALDDHPADATSSPRTQQKGANPS